MPNCDLCGKETDYLRSTKVWKRRGFKATSPPVNLVCPACAWWGLIYLIFIVVWLTSIILVPVTYLIRNAQPPMDSFKYFLIGMVAWPVIGLTVIFGITYMRTRSFPAQTREAGRQKCAKCYRTVSEITACKSCGAEFCYSCLGKTIAVQRMMSSDESLKCLSCGMAFA
jgi:hypothetical protein